MYQDYFGIKENPFSLTPDPRYLYMGKGHLFSRRRHFNVHRTQRTAVRPMSA